MIKPTPSSQAGTEQRYSLTDINRRTLLCSGAAAAVITTMPKVAIATVPMASRSSPIVPYGNPWAPEILANDIAEHLPGYLKAEEALAAGDASALKAWDFHYRSLIDAASRCHDIEPGSDWERELRDRALAIWPSDRQRARMRRPPIEGLSRRFQWMNLVLQTSIRRVVDARAAYDAACCKHGIIQGSLVDDELQAYSVASDAKFRLTRWMKTHMPVTAGDRELRRRLWEMAAGPQFIWEQRELSMRRRLAKADFPRRKSRYKAGHLIDPGRVSWG